MINEIKIPDIGLEEYEVTEIFIKIGDKIKKNQTLITIEGDKTSIEIPSTNSGIIKEIKVKIGDKVKTNSLISIIENEENKEKNIEKKTLNFKEDIKNNKINIHASPLIRSLSREFNINLKKIKGTGIKDRITKEDILNYIKNKNTNILNKKNNYILNNINELNKVEKINNKNEKKIKISNIQKISGKKLLDNWNKIPHVTIFENIDITDLEIFRKKQNLNFIIKKIKLKITPLVFIIKAISIVLLKIPKFNSYISKDELYFNFKEYINIGIAVETTSGLVVPVIKNTDKKNITEISKNLIEISKKARNNLLNKEDIKNGCFTISSLGHIGTKNFTPIINAPEVAILGVSRSSIEPIWNGKNFIPRLILPISISFDHRIIDGADAARFVKEVSYLLSDIRNLIM